MIAVKEEPESLGPPYENCCFCYKETHYWYVKKDVAVCPECAVVRKVAEVPSKDDWCEAVRKKFPSRFA